MKLRVVEQRTAEYRILNIECRRIDSHSLYRIKNEQTAASGEPIGHEPRVERLKAERLSRIV